MRHRGTRLARCAAIVLMLLPGGDRPTHAADSDEVTELNGAIEEVAVAGDGRLLVVKIRGAAGLAVYDADSRKIEGRLSIGTEDFAFGAGGDTVVVAPKGANAIQSWSLNTFTRSREKEFADQFEILRIVMGRSREDLAFIRLARGADALSQTTNQFLDAAELSFLRPTAPVQGQGQGHNSSYRDYVHFRPDSHLDRITEWASSHSPSGIGMVIRTEEGYQYRYNHDSAGYLVPGDDGLIYTGYGIIYRLLTQPQTPFNNYFEPAGKVEGQSLLPGLGGIFFLGIDRDGQLAVYESGQTTPLCRIDPFPGWSLPKPEANAGRSIPPAGAFPPGRAEEWIQTPLTLDQRIVFAPASGYLLFLPPSNDKIVRRDFNLKEALERTGKDYLLILSSPPTRAKAGSRWEYVIQALSKHGPVKYTLERAPEGLTLDPEGRLTWKIPANLRGEGDVAVVVADAEGNEIRHSFTISFD